MEQEAKDYTGREETKRCSPSASYRRDAAVAACRHVNKEFEEYTSSPVAHTCSSRTASRHRHSASSIRSDTTKRMRKKSVMNDVSMS